MITIQPTTNFKILADLNRHVQDWHHQHYPEVFKEFDFEKVTTFFKQHLKDPTCRVHLAISDETPCGYIFCFERYRAENPFQHAEKYLLVDQICVLPEFQRKGIARSLIQKAEAVALELGCQSMQLNHWMGNQSASLFFQKSGFEPYNIQMKKKLSQ